MVKIDTGPIFLKLFRFINAKIRNYNAMVQQITGVNRPLETHVMSLGNNSSTTIQTALLNVTLSSSGC